MSDELVASVFSDGYSTLNHCIALMSDVARGTETRRYSDSRYGAEAVDTGGFLADHLLVAHFVAGPRSQELRCSRAHCAPEDVLRFSITVPRLSQSHRTCPPTSISARRRRRSGAGPARAVQLPCTAWRDRMRVVPT